MTTYVSNRQVVRAHVSLGHVGAKCTPPLQSPISFGNFTAASWPILLAPCTQIPTALAPVKG